ncbi:MAG: TetR/AcrR family transcriptional regulator [Erysipelotrichaceae bacterium]|nr:TetR/AcrR family transcriptional regulator [Erysipelotrichaceae bacterium]
MTTEKKTNYATIRTNRLIKRTFCELIYEKGRTDDITVSELVKKADINRGTFYNHFPNIRAVLTEIMSDIQKAMFDYSAISRLSDFDEYFRHVFNYIGENEYNFHLLLRGERIIFYIGELQEKSKSFIKSKFIESGIELNREIDSTIDFFIGGMVTFIITNLYRDQHFDVEGMMEIRKLWFRKLFGSYY